MDTIIRLSQLAKTYAGGFTALKAIDLEIYRGEIFALLGPNGAGKTTLINIVCGIVKASAGQVRVAGYDIVKDFRASRSLIGLVPQELTTDTFETVWDTVCYSRGLFGKARQPAYIESLLRRLSLWEKRNNKILTLSGGMKRRVMIAKALSHEPKVLFLDEPTAGVDVDLRKSMWEQVHSLKNAGVTVILTTHYIEEAEEMADRVGVINQGRLIVVEEKNRLMQKLGKKELYLELASPLTTLPESLASYPLQLEAGGQVLRFNYDTKMANHGIAELLERLQAAGIRYRDLETKKSSLEDIFVQLVNTK